MSIYLLEQLQNHSLHCFLFSNFLQHCVPHKNFYPNPNELNKINIIQRLYKCSFPLFLILYKETLFKINLCDLRFPPVLDRVLPSLLRGNTKGKMKLSRAALKFSVYIMTRALCNANTRKV